MTDWSKQKVPDLKVELKNRGLPINGLKAELVARLEASDQEEPGQGGGDEQVEDTPSNDAEDEEADAGEANGAAAIAAPSEEEAPTESVPVAAEVIAEDPAQQPVESSAATEVPSDAGASEPKDNREPLQDSSTEENIPQQAEAEQESALAPDAAPESSGPSGTTNTTEPETSVEPASESQKRKRRSATPQPDEEDLARKRARADVSGDVTGSIAPAVRLVDEEDLPAAPSADEAMVDRDDAEPPATVDKDRAEQALDEMDYARDVAPALHPATSALYINNLMRPLRPNDVRAHLASLAAPNGEEPNDNIILNFHLDHIRTHAFVVFDSVSAASRARTALHDCVWPNESNRKALWVDFVPAEKVEGWIEMEEASRNGRSGSRWEVVYDNGPDGVEARLESGAISSSRGNPAPESRRLAPAEPERASAIPLGPRGFRDAAPPTGPRAVRPGTGPGPRPPPNTLGTAIERTRAQPVIAYQMVSDELAARRTENMHSFYTRDTDRDLGREINRYSFEDGDSFVDRGKEVFEGIRPPHRERGGGRDRRGNGRGGYGGRPPRRGPPPFRQRSDRYLPGLSDARNDRRPRHDDDDRGSYRPRDRDRR